MSLTCEPPLAAETMAAPRREAGVNPTALVLELAVRVAAAGNVDSAAKMLADGLCQRTLADQAAVAVRGKDSAELKLVACSAVRQLDANTPLAQALTRELNATPGDESVTWLDDRSPLAATWQTTNLARVNFRDAAGELVASALLAWSQPVSTDKVQVVLQLAAHAIAPIMTLHTRSSTRAWSQRLAESLPTWLTRRRRLALLAATVAALAVPWPYPITAQVTLEPVEHRFVAAPFEGVFEQSLVLPGDQVEPGQVLGRMDGRELRTKLSALEAELARVTRSRDANQATNKLAAAQIDRLEIERLTHERELIEQRMRQLEIRAPIGGVIVSGDLRRHTGATVNVGHALYEVAPLDRLIAEVAIPEAEIEQTSVGAPLRVSLAGLAVQTLSGKLERIHPRAEVRDDQQVFIGEMTVENDRGVYRPGMHGRARITGPATPVAWLLLRKPYLAMRSLVGW